MIYTTVRLLILLIDNISNGLKRPFNNINIKIELQLSNNSTILISIKLYNNDDTCTYKEKHICMNIFYAYVINYSCTTTTTTTTTILSKTLDFHYH